MRAPRRTDDARRLRREGTEAERRLWYRLRSFQVDGSKFRRQHSVGPYIVDFICPSHRLVVEVDGGQHVAAAEMDARRTRYLESRGYRVVRFWNHEVLGNTEGVLAAIADSLRQQAESAPPPHPEFAAANSDLSPEGRGKGRPRRK